MKVELPIIRDEERTPLVVALLDIINQALDHIHNLEETIQLLRDEIAVLKGQKPRPKIQPSILPLADPSATTPGPDRRRGRPSQPRTENLTIHQEVVLDLENPPVGAILKDHEPYIVQDLRIESHNTCYQRARYELPEGGSILTPLPEGVLPVEGGHYGANLVAYIMDQYHQAHVTEPLLLEQLEEYGIVISAGQLHSILTENKERFHQEKEEVLAVGLVESSYIATDDTGARHQGHNGYCTVIGNDLFAYFESTDSKSRLNFLQILQGSQRTYAINEITLAYWEQQKLPESLLNRLTQGPQEWTDEAVWKARLAELGITGERYVRMATEGVLLGGLVARGVSPKLVILSDGALQFVLFVHAACWVHAERPLAKLVPSTPMHRAILEQVRTQLWQLYQDLKSYREHPEASQRRLLEERFDAFVGQRTGYPNIDSVLKEMGEHKADLLRVLERPEVPLHNNEMESDIREYVKRRKISGGTRSDAGRRCRDTFASLKKTCRKLGLRFWDYLQDRIRGKGKVPRLGDLIRQKAREKRATKVEAVPA